MDSKFGRAIIVTILILASGAVGHSFGKNSLESVAVNIPTQTVASPTPGTIRIIYSLDQKQNDKEIIALIDSAKTSIYFAIYEFTLKDVADALVAAKNRGVDIHGVVDSGEAAKSYDKPIIHELLEAGIPVVTEKHASGNGIMHIKAIVTDSTYALGSYNWTSSATNINDELLEVGTDPTLRAAYENVLKKLFEAYRDNSAAANAAASVSVGTIPYTDALSHVGETASVQGVLVDAHSSKSGTVFLDFCKSYKTCPFSGVIFADDAKKFGDLSKYTNTTVTLTGKISSYQGKAEIILSSPTQLSP
jgi:hypothetical protein